MRIKRWIGALGLACVLGGWCAQAQAQDDISQLSEADRQRLLDQLQQANTAFDQGDWNEALLRYETALSIAELPSIQYRRALCMEKQERYAEAVDAYKRFLVLDPDAKEAGRVRADITRLEGLVERQNQSRLSVNTVPAGADVRLDAADGPIVGRTPLVDVRITPGLHTIYIKKEGYRDKVERVDASPGQAVVVSYALEVQVEEEAQVQVSSTPSGAQVKLGGASGRLLGRTPLRAKVPTGDVTLHVEAEGYRPKSEAYRLKAGQEVVLSYSLERLVSAGSDPNGGIKTPPPGTGRGGSSAWGWGLTGAGVLLGVGGGALWYLTESTITEANEYERRDARNSREELEGIEDDVPLLKVLTYVTAGLSGATLVTGLILLVSSGEETPTGASLEVVPLNGGAHVGVQVAF